MNTDKDAAREALELDRCDQISLGWVSEELASLIVEARVSLEHFAEDEIDTAPLVVSENALHKLHNTLALIKLHGASMLAGELEEAVTHLAKGPGENQEATLGALMTGIVALKEYLERLENGAPDVPIILMPLMNELRAVRHVHLLSESAFFSPSLDGMLNEELSRPIYDRGELQKYLREKRSLLNLSLLNWYQGNDSSLYLGKLSAIFDGVKSHCGDPTWRYFKLLAVLCGYLSNHPEESSSGIKLVVGHVNPVIRRILEKGEEAIRLEYPVEQLKNLLFYIGQLEQEDSRVKKLQAEYGLKRELAYLEAGKDGAPQHPAPSVLHAVNDAVQKDITTIKDWVDIYVRGESRDNAVLTGVLPRLRSLSDTLGMLGLGTERIALQQRTDELGKQLDSGETIQDESLEKLADQLLKIEILLPELFAGRSSLGSWTLGDGQGVTETELFSHLWAVVKETKVSMAYVKDALSEFLSGTKTRDDIKSSLVQLGHISGAMDIIGAGHVKQFLEEVRNYIEIHIIESMTQPDTNEINMLADAISGIEYFIEVAPYGCRQEEEILVYVRTALNRLYGEKSKVHPQTVDDAIAELTSELDSDKVVSADDDAESYFDSFADFGAEQSTIVSPDTGGSQLPDVGAERSLDDKEQSEGEVSDIVDEDILEIFREEAGEQLELIQQMYPRWIAYPSDDEARMTVRRAFHTLKGSGRMVGAFEIGDFAWSVENLLNRIIDGTIEQSDDVNVLLDQAVAFLPNLFDSESLKATSDERVAIEQLAHQLASNKTSPVVDKQEADVIDISEALGVEAEEKAVEPTEELVEDSGSEPEPYSPRNDPMLAAIFQDEANGHLSVISEFLDQCDDVGGCKIDDGLVRAFHTLHGSAQLAEVDEIGDLSNAVEKFLREQQLRDQWLTPTDVGGIHRALDYISDAVLRIGRGDRELPDHLELIAEFEKLSLEHEGVASQSEPAAEEVREERVVEEQAATDETRELRLLFLDEAKELLEELEQQISDVEDDSLTEESVVGLKRSLHTLKGAARLIHMPSIGDLSHAFESMLIRAEELGAIESATVYQNARVAVDKLNVQIEQLDDGLDVNPFSDIVSFLEETDFSAHFTAAQSVGVEPEADHYLAAASQEHVAVSGDDESGGVSETAADVIPFPPQRAQKRAEKQKKLRISTNVLDQFVDGIGEAMTFGTRLQQQKGTISTNLNEFEETVNRLREQLRNLEIETESQILYRYEREGVDTENEQFDPLELDRFSTMQELSRALAETVDDLANIKRSIDEAQEESTMLLAQHVRLTTSMQDMLLHTRTLPFAQHIARLERLVRQTSQELGKQANLIVEGKEEEIDRGVLDKTLPLLEHLLRNAVYHGIESPEDRERSGKSPNGRLFLGIRRQGMELVIRLSDDGKGFDRDKIRQTAINKGVIAPDDKQLTDAGLFKLIASAGFTTVESAGQISGRGVGLDVVVTEIEKLGGRIEVTSPKNQGTSFIIHLPFHVAITDALLIQQGDVWYAIPDTSIEAVVRIGLDELEACYSGEQEGFRYAGTTYPVHYLGNLLAVADTRGSVEGHEKWVPLLLVRSGDIPAAIQIDGLHGNRQIVLKPVGSQLESVPWISGGTILGDGRVALIIDPAALVREVAAQIDEAGEIAVVDEPAPLEGRRVTVMVVDDSITMRKVAAGILQRNGYNVVTAKDGLDALSELEAARPDIVLLDIEMPRMDGFEFARHLRSSDEFGNTPIIMVTSRTGEKHKQKALALGVNAYLGKPFAEDELLDNIGELILESVE